MIGAQAQGHLTSLWLEVSHTSTHMNIVHDHDWYGMVDHLKQSEGSMHCIIDFNSGLSL